jgi:hypothetical protein
MPSSYYCGKGGAKPSSNTMNHHHSSANSSAKMYNTAKGEKLNIVDENNLKNAPASATDKKRRLPQSDMMWA